MGRHVDHLDLYQCALPRAQLVPPLWLLHTNRHPVPLHPFHLCSSSVLCFPVEPLNAACVRGSDSMSLILIVSHRTTNVCNFFSQRANSRSPSKPRPQKSSTRVHLSPTKNREIRPVRCQLRCQKTRETEARGSGRIRALAFEL